MSWESDFNSQWETFVDVIESKTRREIETTNKFNYTFVNDVIKQETKKWFQSNHVNEVWLNKLNNKFPTLAQEFQLVLENLKLRINKSITFDSNKISVKILFAIILFSLVHIILEYTRLTEYIPLNQLNQYITKIPFIKGQYVPIIQQLMITALACIIFLPAITLIEIKRKENKINQLLKTIRKDLNYSGIQLRDIAVKADNQT